MKYASLFFLLFLGLIASISTQAEPPENYPFLAFDEGMRLAQQEDKRIFLYFGRLGCGWCDKVNKETFPDLEVRKRYINHYVLVYVDAESGKRLTLPNGERVTEREVGVRFKAFATPMFVYLEPDGSMIMKIAGVQTVRDMLNYDRFVHGELYKKQSFRQFIAENP